MYGAVLHRAEKNLSARYKSHCGAIATPPSLPLTSSPYDFQSHCGAIATSVREIPDTPPKKPLSIPLWCDCDRLRFRSRAVSSCTFNPTVVRLRPSSSYDTSPLCFLSIPLWCDCDADRSIFGCRPDYLSFNPTVVRLRPQDRRQCNEPHGSFNPTVVRLRRNLHKQGA